MFLVPDCFQEDLVDSEAKHFLEDENVSILDMTFPEEEISDDDDVPIQDLSKADPENGSDKIKKSLLAAFQKL